MKKLFYVFPLCVLASCASPYTMKNNFNPDEVKWSLQDGTAVIKGQGFLRTVGGDVKTCAGYPVKLVPYSSYTEEIHNAYLNGKLTAGISNKDTNLFTYRKTTQCDAQGNFEFSNLPAGRWYAETLVHWSVPSGYLNLSQGGWIQSDVISTYPNKTTQVILTK